MNKQVYGGCVSLEGETLGTLFVVRVLRTKPELIYETRCSNCGVVKNYTHSSLRQSGRCLWPTCNLLRERREAERQKQAAQPEPDRHAFNPDDLTVPGKVW